MVRMDGPVVLVVVVDVIVGGGFIKLDSMQTGVNKLVADDALIAAVDVVVDIVLSSLAK